MNPFRKPLLVLAGALALCAVQACTSETELNPQPLPPKDETARTPADNGQLGDPQTGGSGSSGSSGTGSVPGADAGTGEGGDAADGGDG